MSHEKVCRMEDESDLTLALKELCHQESSHHTIAVVVRGYDANILFAGLKPLWDVIHKDQLDPLVGGLLIGGRGGNRIGRNRDDNLRLLGENGFDIGNLLFGLKAGVSHRNYVNAHFRELRLQAGYLRQRPIISRIVHYYRRLGFKTLNFRNLFWG